MLLYDESKMLQLIDTHAHLDEIENLEQVIAQAKAVGVIVIVTVGQDLASNQKTLEIAARYPGLVYPALGYYPGNIKESEITENLDFIRTNVNRAVGIGEVGLDYHKRVRVVADKDLQKRVFSELLKIAKANDKSALIHSRYAWRDALDLVQAAGLKNAVFHWYTGTSTVLRDIIASGYYISATPAVEYHEEHRRAIKETPLEKLLLETDSPVVYGRGRAGELKASPADVVRSLKGAATLKGLSEEEIAKITTENAKSCLALVT